MAWAMCMLALAPRGAQAQADTCGRVVSPAPGHQQDGRACTAFNQGTVFAWRGPGTALSRVYVSYMDSNGVTPPAWPAGGYAVSPDSLFTTTEVLCPLSDSAVVLSWADTRTGAREAYWALMSHSGGGTPGPGSIVADSLTMRASPNGGETPLGIAKQDCTHALVAIWDESGVWDALIKQVGPPGAPSTGWPATGVVVSDSVDVFPLGICSDGADGCYVLSSHDHSCAGDPNDPGRTCPAPEIRLVHLLPDGSLDPAWPGNGVLVADEPGGDNTYWLVADNAKGAYVVWDDQRDTTSHVYGQHLHPDGSRYTGWDSLGTQVFETTDYQNAPVAAVSPDGRLLTVATVNFLIPYAVSRNTDGSLTPGWPPGGIALANPPPAFFYGLTSSALGSDAAGRWVFVFGESQEITGPPFTYAMRGVGIAPDGTVLPGWDPGGTVFCNGDGPFELSLALPGDGTFIVTWDISRNVRFNRYFIQDGAVPTLLEARLLDHALAGRVLRARWLTSAPPPEPVTALRSLGVGAFAPLDELTRQGSTTLALTDTLPAGASGAGYVLAVPDPAGHAGWRAISDTLRVEVGAAGGRVALSCPTPQRGPQLVVDLDVGASAGAIDLAIFDVAGRRLQQVHLAQAPQGRQRLALPAARLGPGLYLVRARAADGARASAAVVRLE